MKTIITFKQIDHSDAVKEYITAHAERIEKYGLKDMELHLTLTKERHLSLTEAALTAKNFRAHVEGSTDDVYSSINQALDRMEKVLQKRTTKIKKSRVRTRTASV